MDNTQLQYIKIQSQYIDKLEQFEKCIIKAAKAEKGKYYGIAYNSFKTILERKNFLE